MKTIILLFVLITSAYGQVLQVVSISPTSNSLYAEVNHTISIEFNDTINRAAINDTTFKVYGRWTGVMEGDINIINENKTLEFIPAKNFNAGEQVTVYISKGFNTDLTLGFNGYTFSYWVKTKEGSFELSKMKTLNIRKRNEGWIQTYGAFAGDLDKDGYTDFIVPNEISNDIRVFINDQTGDYHSFDVYTISNGSRPSTNEGFDFNLDGNMDFAVGNSTNQNVSVFTGDGTGSFTGHTNYTVGEGVRGLSIADFNHDGFPDIVTANRVGSNISILLNNNLESFDADTSMDVGINGETACSIADANNDGILDLFVGGYNSSEVALLLGNANGGFDYSAKAGKSNSQPWMIVAGDVNGDGYADALTANSNDQTMSVYLSDGNGGLNQPVSFQSGIFPLAIDLGDIDGDEDLDVVVSNYWSKDFIIYSNDGNANFTIENTLTTTGAGSCVVLHDRDNDGDLDMTAIDEIDDLLIIYENKINTTDINETTVVKEYKLGQNYPNPFNPATTIEYQITNSSFVKLSVYDALGREIKTLVNKYQNAGSFRVDIDFANEFSSGIYFYKISTNEFSEIKKMMYLK